MRLIMKKTRRYAFTLAEVLITLGIVGVVASLTIPTVVKHYKAKVLETAFKKSVTNLYQAYDLTRQQLGVDNIYQTYVICTSKENCYDENSLEFRETLEKNLKVTSIYKQGFYPLKNYNGTKLITYNIGMDYPEATKILADGSSFGMNTNSDGVAIATIHIFIDTNGPYKGPNRLGYDIFRYETMNYNTMCNPNIVNSENFKGCYYWAHRNVSPQDSSKSYWSVLYKPLSYWKK